MIHSLTLLATYTETRRRTERICSPLKKEDYIPQVVEFASPAKWHLAHTTWFFEEMVLKAFCEAYGEYDQNYSYLFNSYYNAVGERLLRANRGNLTRPDVDDVYDYRRYIDKEMVAFIEKGVDKEVKDRIVLGLNHEQQHQELLITDLKYAFGHNPVFPVYDDQVNFLGSSEDTESYVKMNAGLYDIGFAEDGFCFDNELARHKVYLDSFELAKSLVSNRNYLEFIEDGAYDRFELWLDEGWAWIKENKIAAPLYWHNTKTGWKYYTLSGLKSLNLDEKLCHVSYYEAAAYASWKNMRLPTEFEWEAASKFFAWGDRWEWTNSAYLPYPGFDIAPGALGEYNGKFMVNQMVLKGASRATAQGHSRASYRNFFHPHLQWQYSGVRLAKKQNL